MEDVVAAAEADEVMLKSRIRFTNVVGKKSSERRYFMSFFSLFAI